MRWFFIEEGESWGRLLFPEIVKPRISVLSYLSHCLFGEGYKNHARHLSAEFWQHSSETIWIVTVCICKWCFKNRSFQQPFQQNTVKHFPCFLTTARIVRVLYFSTAAMKFESSTRKNGWADLMDGKGLIDISYHSSSKMVRNIINFSFQWSLFPLPGLQGSISWPTISFNTQQVLFIKMWHFSIFFWKVSIRYKGRI